MGKRRTQLALFGIAVSIALGLGTSIQGQDKRGTTRVLVDSWARDDYQESKRGESGELRYETYHILKGEHYGGNIRDPSLRQVDFQEVAGVLAQEMRARNYYPATVTEQGDFLIVVHWGVTMAPDPIMGDSDDSDSLDEPDVFDELDYLENSDELDDNDYAFADQRMNMNAELTGFNRFLENGKVSIQTEWEFKDMLREERYFMILMAYDWQKLRTEKERVLMWSTRFSLRANSTNFRDAHFALSRGAAQFFGTNLEGTPGRARVNLGPGEIEFGDLEVVDTAEEEAQ